LFNSHSAFRNARSDRLRPVEKPLDIKADAEKMDKQKRMKETAKQAVNLMKLKAKDPKFSASSRFVLSIVERDKTEEAEVSSMNTRRDIAERRYRQNKKASCTRIYRKIRRAWQEKTSISLQAKVRSVRGTSMC
jgi:hypothetical protein